MDFLKLTEEVLSVDSIMKLVSSEKCGAVSMFIGTTRNNFEGKEVKNLEYEAYEPMALKVMKNICCEIRNKWEQIENIAIYHRLGTVPVLEASVVIAISSPHRVESLAAVQYCIENLKVINLEDEKELKNQNDLNNSRDPHTVQIIASHSEMKLRIEKYTKRKREQNDLNNINDFINHTAENVESSEVTDANTTCARVDAILLKSKDSKSHLKVMRTQNEWGPQTKIEKFDEPKMFSNDDATSQLCSRPKSGIEERLLNVEQHLNVSKPISSDIYSRLKKIEDRILEIESISPEYAKYWSRKDRGGSSCDLESDEVVPKRMKFSSEDIWNKIKMIKKT